MSTYNLPATDLITLLQSTVQPATGGALVNALFAAGDFPFVSSPSPDYVQTNVGPDGAPLTTQNVLIEGGVKFELITLPTSTAVTGASYPAPTIGSTPETNFNFLSSGGVIIGAGDQGVSVVDSNNGSKADTVIGGLGPEKLTSSGLHANLLIAGAGANTLQGGQFGDTLVGAGNSRLIAGVGANLLEGGTIAGAHDTLLGGTGADTLSVTYGANRLTAGGANTLYAGAGTGTMASAKGDTLVGAGGASLVGGMGNTRFIAEGGAETLVGGSGLDTMAATSLTSSITASLGSGYTLFRDVITDTAPGAFSTQGGASATITGGSGGAKVVLGATGDDSILSGSGAIKILSSQTLADYDPAKSSHSGATSTLVFDNGQTIVVNDVNADITIHFSGGGSVPV